MSKLAWTPRITSAVVVPKAPWYEPLFDPPPTEDLALFLLTLLILRSNSWPLRTTLWLPRRAINSAASAASSSMDAIIWDFRRSYLHKNRTSEFLSLMRAQENFFIRYTNYTFVVKTIGKSSNVTLSCILILGKIGCKVILENCFEKGYQISMYVTLRPRYSRVFLILIKCTESWTFKTGFITANQWSSLRTT